ncbi:hypothetical protein PR048_032595 [Dryococelus australis]|uniref:Uncharacterized protein n=1 Tax=Dryococelus australis TaxID=614101 RepID=A0ABQ9G2N2_9NEOP|nr:hypothetical protein PR048_032595 [Dryococelus australis]
MKDKNNFKFSEDPNELVDRLKIFDYSKAKSNVDGWKEHLKNNPVISIKPPYDRVKRCRERKINTEASERVNVDLFTKNKRPCRQHSHTPFLVKRSLLELCTVFPPMRPATLTLPNQRHSATYIAQMTRLPQKVLHTSSHAEGRAALAGWLACPPPTKVNRVQSPDGPLPDFHMWESCRTMSLVGGFSRGFPVHPALPSRRSFIFTSITLIGSQTSLLRAVQISSLTHSLFIFRSLRSYATSTSGLTSPLLEKVIPYPFLISSYRWRDDNTAENPASGRPYLLLTPPYTRKISPGRRGGLLKVETPDYMVCELHQTDIKRASNGLVFLRKHSSLQTKRVDCCQDAMHHAENTARQFRALRLVAMGDLMHVEVSTLLSSPPPSHRFTASNARLHQHLPRSEIE